MRKKVLLLTLFMAICPFIFGQDPDWGEYDYHNWSNSTTFTAFVHIDNNQQSNRDLVIAPFCNNERRGNLCTPQVINQTTYLYMITAKGNYGDKITFKLFDKSVQSEFVDTDYVYTFVPDQIISGVVINFNSVAKVGDVKFGSVIDAVNYAEAGQTVTLTNDSEITSTVVINKAITLDLNGKKVEQVADKNAVRVTSDNVIITDSSENGDGAILNELFYAVTVGRNDQSDRGGLTINGGKFEGQTTSVYVACGDLEIRGGEFSINEIDPQGYKYVVNLLDNKDANALIYGGTFHNFNPQNNEAEGVGTNFCAEGYIAKDNGNNTYTVIADPAYGMVARIGDTYFATLEAAIAAAQEGDEIDLLADITASEIITINKSVVIDLNGKTVTSTAKKAFEVYANASIMNGTIYGAERAVDTRKAVTLSLADVALATTATGVNTQPLTIGGSEDGTVVTLTNVNINAGTSGYGIISFVETELTATESTIEGYCALYVKPGSEGSSFNFVKSTLSGSTANNDVEGNSFSTIAVRADDVTVTVDANSTVKSSGNYCHAISLGGNYDGEETTEGNEVTIAGTIEGNILYGACIEANTVKINEAYASNLQAEGFITSEAENGLVTVTGTAAAKIGEKYYATFDAAYKAAKKGDTIELLRTAVITNFKTWINYSTKNITVKAEFGDVAFRVQDNAYVWFGGMTIESDDYCIIVGASDGSSGADVEIYGGTYNGETSAVSVTKGSVKIMGGTFKVEPYQGSYEYTINCIDANYNNGTADVSIQGGKFYNFNPENNAAEGAGTNFLVNAYTAVYDAEGYWEVVEAVAKIGDVNYTSLVDAIKAAQDGDEIKVLRNSAGAGAFISKSITIDFGGYTYSFTEPAVGSTGTQSNGFQILKNNNVTLKNGTLNVDSEHSGKYYILVQNYANLNVVDMTLDGTNLDKWSLTDGDSYVLSNNSGTVSISCNTNIIANNEGDLAFAFDACDKSAWGYELPTVTVNTTGTIDGAIEVSATLNITAANLSERSYIVMQENGQLFHNGITATIKKEIAKSSGEYGVTTNWNTISTPVKGGSNIQAAEDGRHDLYHYDEAAQTWKYQETGVLTSGKGYLYTNHKDVKFSFTGELNTEAVNVELSYTEGITLAGFNLIGNPFTYTIGTENFATKAQLADGFYTITKEGAWQAQQAGETIAPLQSVLVKADRAETLTINPKANRTRKAANASLEIAVYNSEYKDVAYVSFGEGLGLDKIEHRNSDIPMVFVPVNGKEYAIATMSSDVKEIPVAFKAMTMGQYTLAVNARDCEYSEMYIVDNLTGEVTDLLNNDYTFIATSKDDANRFVIKFAEETETTTSTENFAYINNGEIIIDSIEGKGVVRIYDMLGRPISEYGVSESARISTSAFADGFYIIQMSDDNGVKVQKVVID